VATLRAPTSQIGGPARCAPLSTPRLAVALAVIGTLLATSVAAGAAGAALILGQSNSAGGNQTTLNSTSSNPTLRVNNGGTGRGLEVEADTAVPLRVIGPGGSPPLTVNSSTKVVNLNADRLDGLNSTAFLQGAQMVTYHAGPWVAYGGASAPTLEPLLDGQWWLDANALGANAAVLALPTPGDIGITHYAFASVELCTNQLSNFFTLDEVRVLGVDASGTSDLVVDGTDHAVEGAQCWTYTNSSPTAGWAVSLWAQWNVTISAGAIYLRRVAVTWLAI